MLFTKSMPWLVLSLTASLIPSVAIAQVQIQPMSPQPESLPEMFERAFNHGLGNAMEQTTIGSQLNLIFGWRSFPQGSFPENQINRQASLLHTLFVDAMAQQTQKDAILRTRDLANPFNTSIQQDPNYLSPSPSSFEQEFRIEQPPF